MASLEGSVLTVKDMVSPHISHHHSHPPHLLQQQQQQQQHQNNASPRPLVVRSPPNFSIPNSILRSPPTSDKHVYCFNPPSGGSGAGSMDGSGCRLIEYRGAQVAAFKVDGRELICLPQAFDLFLKNLVGGLHTVYTKLKRLDITPIVCNVEQVRILRGLGAIQPGVNRCKLISPQEFDVLYDDCTNSSARPGRPPKRSPISTTDALEQLKRTKLASFSDFYAQNRLFADAKKALQVGGYGGGPGSGAGAGAGIHGSYLSYVDFKKSAALFGGGMHGNAAAAAGANCYHYAPSHLPATHLPFMPFGYPHGMMNLAMTAAAAAAAAANLGHIQRRDDVTLTGDLRNVARNDTTSPRSVDESDVIGKRDSNYNNNYKQQVNLHHTSHQHHHQQHSHLHHHHQQQQQHRQMQQQHMNSSAVEPDVPLNLEVNKTGRPMAPDNNKDSYKHIVMSTGASYGRQVSPNTVSRQTGGGGGGAGDKDGEAGESKQQQTLVQDADEMKEEDNGDVDSEMEEDDESDRGVDPACCRPPTEFDNESVASNISISPMHVLSSCRSNSSRKDEEEGDGEKKNLNYSIGQLLKNSRHQQQQPTQEEPSAIADADELLDDDIDDEEDEDEDEDGEEEEERAMDDVEQYSIETLLSNIQGLISLAVENARQREQQTRIEKAILQKKLKKEKETRRLLQDQLNSALSHFHLKYKTEPTGCYPVTPSITDSNAAIAPRTVAQGTIPTSSNPDLSAYSSTLHSFLHDAPADGNQTDGHSSENDHEKFDGGRKFLLESFLENFPITNPKSSV